MFFRKITNQWKRFISFLKFDFAALEIHQEIQEKDYLQIENDIKRIDDDIKRIDDDIKRIDDGVNRINDNLEKLDSISCFFHTYTELFNPELFGLLITLPTDKLNVLICGYYGAPNLGDELMLQTLLKLIDNKKIHVTLMLTDCQCVDESLYGNVSVIHYLKTKNDYNILAARYDAVIFGGGAVLDEKQYSEYHPYYQELGQILLGLGKAFIAHGKKVIGIGLSTNKDLMNIDFIRDLTVLINYSTFFSLRDKFSLETLKRCEIDVKRIRLIKDIVWANEEFLNVKYEFTDNIKKIGVIWAHFEEPVQHIINMLCELDNTISEPYSIQLIPFYTGKCSDLSFYRDIISLCPVSVKNRLKIIDEFWEIEKCVEIINEQDCIINMRYHGALLAGILDVPCITIWHDEHPHYFNKMKYIESEFPKSENLLLSEFETVIIARLTLKLLHTQHVRVPRVEDVSRAKKEMIRVLEDYLLK